MKKMYLLLAPVLLLNSFFQSALAQNDGVSKIKKSAATTSPTTQDLATPSFFFGAGTLVSTSPDFLAPRSGSIVSFEFEDTELRIKSKFDTGSNDAEISDRIGTVQIANAISENFFIGASFNTRNSDNSNEWKSQNSEGIAYVRKSEGKRTGTSDPTISAGVRSDGTSVSSIFGLGVTIQTGDNESVYKKPNDGLSTSTDTNKMGGSYFTPRFSIFSNNKNSTMIGLATAYDIQGERTSKDFDSDGSVRKYTYTNGNRFYLSSFVEVPLQRNTLGANVSYSRYEKSTVRNESYGSSYDSSPIGILTATVYSNFQLSQNFALIPSLGYGQLLELSDNMSQKDLFSGTLKARISF